MLEVATICRAVASIVVGVARPVLLASSVSMVPVCVLLERSNVVGVASILASSDHIAGLVDVCAPRVNFVPMVAACCSAPTKRTKPVWAVALIHNDRRHTVAAVARPAPLVSAV